MRLFRNGYPLLGFFLKVYKFQVATHLCTESTNSYAYDYIRLRVDWGGTLIHEFRLYRPATCTNIHYNGVVEGVREAQKVFMSQVMLLNGQLTEQSLKRITEGLNEIKYKAYREDRHERQIN
jgi:hypothetical protein